ncbi:MAG: DNA gyrase subunit A [Defluviitaleaceae bacterium]|nr:DNA gyrase subunit A [Defluviitaleaceae bacterium]MCL2273292.1 DNA gyrase subunit A [Defluviitaleaceae bacterium]
MSDRIHGVDISKEMQESFIAYAMSVIVARALPDVRDGLKPVHRRILYAMKELNLNPGGGYRKSAKIVGDTMGNYHPHGNKAIYDAMVRMAQDFSIRYCLVDGHGNFGSMDGDEPAADRYTEAKLTRLSMEMLQDIDKETVNFVDNYDGSYQEPSVLPSRFPNLLVNGSTGIAVGMATNIPPHNLTDVIEAVLTRVSDMREGRETEISTLINIVKAPDYPTGGAILGTASVRNAYKTGRGRVVVRADVVIEPLGGSASGSSGREQIRVTAVPYQVNKAEMVKKIADLVKDKKIDGITDIRDESNRNGVRVIIELRRDANANVILNQLYKLSSLQTSYGITMLALVNNEPKILNLAELIEYYILHQKDVITRRSQFDLDKAERRAHILEGLLKALDHIDEIIRIIRSSKDDSESLPRLMEQFGFSEVQAKAILDMRLRTLQGLSRDRLEAEYNELMALIKELRHILDNENRLLEVLSEELGAVQKRFGDERRTAILADIGEILDADLIDEEDSVITLSHMNYIKRIALDTYRAQGRGGRGVVGLKTREEDWVKDLFVSSTHDQILFFTNFGRVYKMRAFEIPIAGRTARGMAMVNLLNLNPEEKIAAMIPISVDSAGTFPDAEEYLIMVTRNGVVKRTLLSAFANINRSGLIALNIREDDDLIAVLRSDGRREIFLATERGRGIRFAESQVRAMGRTASGVRGIKLRTGDRVVGATVADEQVLLVSSKGYGKGTLLEDCRGQNRGGMGIIVYKTGERTGTLVGITACGQDNENDELMLINSEGVIIRIRIADISVQGRYASGVKLINMDEGTTVAAMAKIVDGALESETDNGEPEEDM